MSATARPRNGNPQDQDPAETVETPIDSGVPEDAALDPEKLAFRPRMPT